MAADVAGGRRPAAVVATAGTTATTAFDPLADICQVAQSHGAVVHVDAAMAGSAMLLPEYRGLFDGIEGASSLSWNPHKWLGSVLETSLFYVQDPGPLVSVMATDPSYLRSARDGSVVQYRDWGLPLGRRFRALRLWSLLRLEGAEAIRARLRRDLANAQRLAALVEQAPGWRLVAPVKLQTVCVLHVPDGLEGADLDAHTLKWCEAVNASGRRPPDPGCGGRPLGGEDFDRFGDHGVVRRGSHVAPGANARRRHPEPTSDAPKPEMISTILSGCSRCREWPPSSSTKRASGTMPPDGLAVRPDQGRGSPADALDLTSGHHEDRDVHGSDQGGEIPAQTRRAAPW